MIFMVFLVSFEIPLKIQPKCYNSFFSIIAVSSFLCFAFVPPHLPFPNYPAATQTQNPQLPVTTPPPERRSKDGGEQPVWCGQRTATGTLLLELRWKVRARLSSPII
jgi:hypothetical protein